MGIKNVAFCAEYKAAKITAKKNSPSKSYAQKTKSM